MRIIDLRCEYLSDPQGLDELQPRLGWRVETSKRNWFQKGCRICVASTRERLERGEIDLWDSGRLETDQTTQHAYRGRELSSRLQCFWQVEVWDESGERVQSAIAHWSMGLLQRSEWRAKWIAGSEETLRRDSGAVVGTLTEPGSPFFFRKEFFAKGPIARATVFASARGVFELHLGGRKVGRDLFAPEWTDYRKRIHYRTYDVTSQIKEGANVLGAILGDGWWTGYVGWQETRGRYGTLQNSLIVQLEIEYATGERDCVCSDASWMAGPGPIVFSDMMMGETYDARRELTGWLEAGWSSMHWMPAVQAEEPTASLVAQRGPAVRVTELLECTSLTQRAPGVFIADLGQNITGWVRLKVKGSAGTRIQLRHGECLSPDGALYTENLRRAKATDVYVCRSRDEEIFEPRFTFHGFRYVEISGSIEALEPSAITACVIHSATPPTGWFECSHPGVNRIWLNGVWSQRDNFLSVPTDCPQRDERLGWMGDAQVFLRTATYNMDVASFFTKWMIDVEDAQTSEGIFPDVAPRVPEDINFVGLDGLCGAAGWADAGVIVPWTIWRVYGDKRIIERHWSAMVAWLNWLDKENPSGLRLNQLFNNYGDWLCIPSDTTFRTHSPMKNLLATAYWADDAAKMSRMARELGLSEEERRFREMFERVRTAFQKEYVRDDGSMTVETQTAYLLALAFDLLPQTLRAKATARLVENIAALDWHLSTGFIGISHLQPTLTQNGRSSVAYKLLLQETYPSWLYPVLHGATTIWERWNGWTEKDGFFNPHMNSFNHYSLGSVGEWFFRHVCGIELHPEHSGFKQFLLNPFPTTKLTFARASYRCAYGEIESEWRRTQQQFSWRVRVPPNTCAHAFIPSDEGTEIQLESNPLQSGEGLSLIGRNNGRVVCELGSGEYNFTSIWKGEA